MNPRDQLCYILPTLSSVVDRVRPEQLRDPTPCPEFAVSDLLEHTIALGSAFASAFRGEAVDSCNGVAVCDDEIPSEEFRRVMDDLLAAVKAPGAMDRSVDVPFGARSGEEFARLVALDGLVRGFDLHRSTGVRFEVPPTVIAAAHEFARDDLCAETRARYGFAEPAPAPTDSSPLTALAAFCGRTI